MLFDHCYACPAICRYVPDANAIHEPEADIGVSEAHQVTAQRWLVSRVFETNPIKNAVEHITVVMLKNVLGAGRPLVVQPPALDDAFEGANGAKESFATSRAALSFNVPDYQDWS